MQDIDFLPIEYHRKREQRRAQPWQIVAAAAIVGLVAAAAISQHYQWIHAQNDWEAIAPAYETAVQMQNQLAKMQQRLNHAKASAELYTYLRHPWPRTQLLSALMNPLPDAVAFQQVRIVHQAPTTSSPPKTPAAIAKSGEPAERDLAKLRERLDSMQTIIVLSGTVVDSSMLLQYMNDLEAADLFENAELGRVSGGDNGKEDEPLQFRIVLGVKPGYGQPGGPTGPERQKIAKVSSRDKRNSPIIVDTKIGTVP
jgi:hypothetical protein